MPDESPADVALQFIREDIGRLRGDMQSELSAVHAKISEIGKDLRTFIEEHGPQAAVFEHRLGEAERDIEALKKAQEAEHAARHAASEDERREKRRIRWSVATAACAAALAFLMDLLRLING